MSESHRELLLGYLCGALDEDDNQKVQQKLKQSESLQLELAALRKEMRSLAQYAQWTEREYEPPQGLARRTCRQIWDQVDGRRQVADGGLRHKIDRKTKQGEWKFSDVLSTICIGVVALLLLVPTFYFAKNQVVQFVQKKTVKKIVNNTAALSQIHEESLLLGKGDNLIGASVGGTDLGTLLASFGETNLSQKTLNFLLPGQKEVGQFSLLPQPSGSTLIGHFPVVSLSQSYLQSFPHPQITGLFDPQVIVSSPFSEKTPGLIFIEWDGISTPIFVEIGGEKPDETLLDVSNEQNLIYRDGRIFFRKPGQSFNDQQPYSSLH